MDRLQLLVTTVSLLLVQKVIGAVHLGNDIAVSANAVVTKSFSEDKITLGRVPAKKISNHSSRDFLADGLFEN